LIATFNDPGLSADGYETAYLRDSRRQSNRPIATPASSRSVMITHLLIIRSTSLDNNDDVSTAITASPSPRRYSSNVFLPFSNLCDCCATATSQILNRSP
jgi:hypothetical protein